MREDVLAAIYDAPLAAQPWVALAPALRALTNANSILIEFTPVGQCGGGVMVADAEWDSGAAQRLYRDVYRFRDPVGYERMIAGRIYGFEDLITRDALRRSDYYERFCKPLNIEHAFFCYLGRHDGVDAWLKGARDMARGRFGEGEVRLISDLLPHLDRAVRTYLWREKQRVETRLYAQTVAALGVGAVLLDGQGRIAGSNGEADLILSEGHAISRVANRLRLAGGKQRHYAQALETVATDPACPVQIMTAEDDGGQRVSLVIRRIEDMTGIAASPVAAFVVYLHRDAPGSFSRMVAFVVENLGLTQAEARVAVMLAEGLALDEIAQRLGVTLTSVRTYGKRALAKTGTSRQVDLVRLVLSGLARLA